MTSLFRLAQSAINPALHGYSNPHHESHHLTDPDLDAFAEPELPDDQDDSDDDDQPLDHYARGQSRGANATSSSSSSSPAAGTSSAYPPANAQEHRLPGGYDFEPQAEPIRSVAAAAPSAPRTRPSSTSTSSRDGALALPISRRASLSSQRYRESSSSYATEHGATASASAGGEQPALAVWRGFVTRLRGSNAGGSTGGGAQQQHAGEEGHGLLFSQDDSEDPSDADWPLQRSNTAGGGGASQYPPPRDPHLPLPPRPPQFAPPPSSSSASAPTGSTATTNNAGGQRVFGGGQGNDGVFANLAAKPDNPGGLDIVGEGPDKDEVLPPYEAAQHDPSPAYWETTVIAPSGPLGPDDILVDGMPVGNVFSFVWNLLVSMSFQFVGFLLTFILHTTHAAKNGSRAGLGITLIQLGFYLKQRTDGLSSNPGDEIGLNGGLGPSESEQSWSWWNDPGGGGADQPTGTLPSGLTPTATLAEGVFGSLPTQVHGALAGVLAANDGLTQSQGPGAGAGMPTLQGDGATLEEMQRMSEAANEWMAFVLVTIGSFLLIGSCLAYWRAVRWARAVRAGQGPNNDAESVVAI
ncbi:hypothetical protein B0A53_03060 [Rhodotorula sp. CCFEE 5036]|nr:hypothetical protein B0A53_03060 [Rhodotorula sp. CCFEE 5036]